MSTERLFNLMFMCHRLPERSFHFRGRQFPICARCTGIMIGYILGGFYGLFLGVPPLASLVLLILPLALDGMGQYLDFWESNNLRRIATGIMAGFSTDFILYSILALGIEHGKAVAKLLI